MLLRTASRPTEPPDGAVGDGPELPSQPFDAVRPCGLAHPGIVSVAGRLDMPGVTDETTHRTTGTRRAAAAILGRMPPRSGPAAGLAERRHVDRRPGDTPAHVRVRSRRVSGVRTPAEEASRGTWRWISSPRGVPHGRVDEPGSGGFPTISRWSFRGWESTGRCLSDQSIYSGRRLPTVGGYGVPIAADFSRGRLTVAESIHGSVLPAAGIDRGYQASASRELPSRRGSAGQIQYSDSWRRRPRR